jgi:GT2 family glycosyltransferase
VTIVFPEVPDPTLSVIMVTYGRWDWVQRSLEAVLANTPPVYEVFVVDNASPDGTDVSLDRDVRGIHLIRNLANDGFPAAINRGAEAARGEHLCLLNSDAVVEPGWWEAMRRRFQDATVGAVAPLYLDVDGAVSEAGSAIGSDGVTIAIGRGLAPDDPSVAFPRDVDFASAACLVVRAATFRDAGGLSEAYGPGYYEDVELSFRLRERGMRTVFEPEARVVHAGSASAGPTLAAERSRRSRDVFRSRIELSGRPPLEHLDRYPHRAVLARDALTPLRVLILAPSYPREGSLSTEAVEALAASAERVRVTLAVGQLGPDHLAKVASSGVEVVIGADGPWLQARPGHPTVIVADGPASVAPFVEAMGTQPQASVIYDLAGDGTGDHVADRRAESVFLRQAAAVFAPSEAHARFVRELVPWVVCLESPERFRAEVASDALSFAGVAVPDPIVA